MPLPQHFTDEQTDTHAADPPDAGTVAGARASADALAPARGDPAGDGAPMAPVRQLPGTEPAEAGLDRPQCAGDAAAAVTQRRYLAVAGSGAARWGSGAAETAKAGWRGSFYTDRPAALRDLKANIDRDEWFEGVPLLRRAHQGSLWVGLVWKAVFHALAAAGATPTRQLVSLLLTVLTLTQLLAGWPL